MPPEFATQTITEKPPAERQAQNQHSTDDRDGKHENGGLGHKHQEGPASKEAKESQAEVDRGRPAPAEDARGCTLTDVSLSGDKDAPIFANGGGDHDDDLESGPGLVRKPPAYLSLRYYIMLLALVSPFIVTYSKTIINFAIIDMIDPNYLRRASDNANRLAAPPAIAAGAPASGTDNGTAPQLDYFDLDNSCPVDGSVRGRLLRELASDERRATETHGEKFQWDTDKQGYLKAAYSIGHMLLQVAGGRLSEIYGSQFIMSLSACLIAMCCLSAPFLASVHFYLLFADLFVLGILGSFMTPSLITLFANWLTPGEKSLMMSFYLVSSRLGYALSSLLCGLLIDAQLSWRYMFYTAGWVSLGFGNVFFVCSRNRPQEHPFISKAELEYLASKNTLVREALARKRAAKANDIEMAAANGNQANKVNQTAVDQNDKSSERANTNQKHPAKSASAPWLAILSNAPVWAFIITKMCVKLMGDTVQTELPVYLKRVMHMESKYNGYINSANYVIFSISCIVVGTLAKWVNKRRPFGFTKTTVRKIFQCTASFGVSLVLLGVSLNVCNETITLDLFMSLFLLTTFSTGGEAQIPLDLSERYAGTIHAIGGTMAISGAIEPILVGQFLLGHSADKGRWAIIWLGASAISALGGLIFLTLGDAKIQAFDKIDSAHKKTAGSGDEPKANGHQAVAPEAVAPFQVGPTDIPPVIKSANDETCAK